MKLIRFGQKGAEKTGVVINGMYYDTSSFGQDYNEAFFHNDGLSALQEFIGKHKGQLPVVSQNERIASPVARPSKIVCVGLNYEKHAIETNAPIPLEPVLFIKSATSLSGPYDDIILPPGSVKTDWEVELALVIGKETRYVSEDDAFDYVAGYCLHNDVSEREYQLERGGTWDKGKGCDSFAPLGPWFVTKEEIPDVNNLRLWLKVNGKIFQDGNTNDLIFNIPALISYISKFMTLLPGDIVSTGTPHGVGIGFSPPKFLQEGDVVELGIDGLGVSRQRVKRYSSR